MNTQGTHGRLSEIIEGIMRIVDSAIRRPGLRGAEMVRLGTIRQALEMLPRPPVDGTAAALHLSRETDSGRSIWSFHISDDAISLEVTETIREPYSSETTSRDIFSADQSSRSESDDHWEGWIDSFASHACDDSFVMEVHWEQSEETPFVLPLASEQKVAQIPAIHSHALNLAATARIKKEGFSEGGWQLLPILWLARHGLDPDTEDDSEESMLLTGDGRLEEDIMDNLDGAIGVEDVLSLPLAEIADWVITELRT